MQKMNVCKKVEGYWRAGLRNVIGRMFYGRYRVYGRKGKWCCSVKSCDDAVVVRYIIDIQEPFIHKSNCKLKRSNADEHVRRRIMNWEANIVCRLKTGLAVSSMTLFKPGLQSVSEYLIANSFLSIILMSLFRPYSI